MNNTTTENKRSNMVFVEPKNTKIPFCIASILFIATPIIQLILGLSRLFLDAANYLTYTEGLKTTFIYYFRPQFINAEFILCSLIMIALGVLLLFKRSGIELAIALILYALVDCLSVFPAIISFFSNVKVVGIKFALKYTLIPVITNVINSCVVLICLGLLAVLVFMLLKKKPRTTISLLCFVPGLALFVWHIIYDIINVIQALINKNPMRYILNQSISLTDYLFPIAVILLGLWLYKVWGTYGTMKKQK